MKKFLIILFSLFLFLGIANSQNYSLQFDGVDDYTDFGNGVIFNFQNSDFTISTYFKANTLHFGSIIDKIVFTAGVEGIGYRISTRGDGELWFTFGQAGPVQTLATANYVANQWHYVVCIKKADSLYIYLDGIESQRVFTNITTVGNNINLWAGGSDDYGFERFNGYIDEICMWNRALSSEEIQEKMGAKLIPENEIGLVGYWSLEEGTGTITSDFSGNGNSGTIVGAIWSTDAPPLISPIPQPLYEYKFVEYPDGVTEIDLETESVDRWKLVTIVDKSDINDSTLKKTIAIFVRSNVQ